jgi:rhamnulokinase
MGTTTHRFVAFDLGAESGRGVLGSITDGRIALEELHRFPTEGITVLGTRQWNYTRIYEEMVKTLANCAKKHGPRVDGVGVDTWGVDFGLVARDGAVIANPTHYRDRRTEGIIEATEKTVSKKTIFDATGIAFHPFNTLFQLLALARDKSPQLQVAETLLLMGDLFGYLLSGTRACEYTNASTTQMLDPLTRTWHDELIAQLGLPRGLLLPPVKPGTVLGPLLPDIVASTGLDPSTPVIAPATHDTASAVASVPVVEEGDNWAYLSSGTWSLLGVELDQPFITDGSLEAGFTNEGGVNGKIRFLKNIIGLWLVQECRRAWRRQEKEYGYAQLAALAAEAEPFRSIIDVHDDRLLAPADMTQTLCELCREAGLPAPATPGAMIRCALESLAVCYRHSLRDMERMLGRKIDRLHVIGGGSQNELLNQMTADACGIPVIAGPVEATALGNIVVQAMAAGVFESLQSARRAIAHSLPVKTYTPVPDSRWDQAAQRMNMS